jgi:chromate transporter
VAVAIVAQAVVGMARTLCPDRQRASIAALAAVLVLNHSSSGAQIGAILLGAIAGFLVCQSSAPVSAAPLGIRVSPGVGIASLAAFTILLLGLPLCRSLGAPEGIAVFDAFYRSGALVFGGGHVVLPLLRDAFVEPGWVSDNTFLAGYGAAQAVPGPLFTFAAYLGAAAETSPHGVLGAAVGLLGIFLPGMLVLLGALPFWDIMRARRGAQAAMDGINAAVVGLLGAALYSPLGTSSVNSRIDVAVALIGFVLLTVWHARPLWVVILGALAGMGEAILRP